MRNARITDDAIVSWYTLVLHRPGGLGHAGPSQHPSIHPTILSRNAWSMSQRFYGVMQLVDNLVAEPKDVVWRCVWVLPWFFEHLRRSFNSWVVKIFILTVVLRNLCWICTSWSLMQASTLTIGTKLKLWQKRGLVAAGVGRAAESRIFGSVGFCWCHSFGLY